MAFVGISGVSLGTTRVSAQTCGASRSAFVSPVSLRSMPLRTSSATELQYDRKRSALKMAASVASNSGEIEKTKAERITLGFYIVCWYAANISFNIANKKLLKAFPMFATVTATQLGMGAAVAIVLWTLGLYKRHPVTKEELKAIYPLALAHLLGNLLTNISIRQMAVSFTHTVKAMEPFFSVLMSRMFIPGAAFHPFVYASLLPIVAGVTLASANEVSFNWTGFITALLSNISFQSRNVLSKRSMSTVQMDNLNLFGNISILSFLTLLPFALVIDASKYSSVASTAAAAGLSVPALITSLAVCGVLHFLYNQFSYVVLRRVNAVTHAVGNTMKRVAVIVSSVLVFQNEVTPLNKLGTSIAILGVAIYSQVKRLKVKKST